MYGKIGRVYKIFAKIFLSETAVLTFALLKSGLFK